MIKRTYTKPSLQVVMIESINLIAKSNYPNNVALGLDLDETESEGLAE